MRIVGDHQIKFVLEGKEDVKPLELPILINPIYVYKIGDRFKLVDIGEDTKKDTMYEVVQIENELLHIIEGEQKIIMTIKKVDNG